MSPTRAARSLTEVRPASVAGKVFLLGEYSVLAGYPALVAAVGPRFELAESAGEAAAIHPESPAGRLLATVAAANGGLIFNDPYRGEGGFGASTAQFALFYARLAAERGWDLDPLSARRAYRELAVGNPSGADLVAQWEGGVVEYEPLEERIAQRYGDADWSRLLVFSAAGQPGRKVATHDHLSALGGLDGAWVGELAAITRGALADLADRLGPAMRATAEVLAEVGLECEAARGDREAISRLPGVAGAKGAGAMLADIVIVWMRESAGRGSLERKAVLELARERGLRLIADGLEREAGIST